MKILSIGHSEEGGGLQTVFKISNQINDESFEITRAFSSDSMNRADLELKRTRELKGFFRRGMGYFYIPYNYKKIKNYLLHNKVDIIHLHGHGELSLSVLHAIKRYKDEARIILTTHGHGLVCPNYSCYSFGKKKHCYDCILKNNSKMVIVNNCDKRGKLFSTLRYLEFALHKKITDNYRLYDRVITPSSYLKSLLEKSGSISNDIKVIENPIDIQDKKKEYKKENIICYAGRFSPEKNVGTLIEAFAKLVNQYGVTDYKLHLIGDGGEKDSYLNKIKKLNMGQFVKLSEGFVSKDILQEHLRKSKIFVLPSVCPETFGLVILESIKCDLVPITMDIGGQAENVKKYNCGELYNHHFSEDISESISKVINDYKNYSISVKKAQTLINENYSVDAYHKKLSSLYYEVLNDANTTHM